MKNKKKTWGILLIVLPVVGLPVVLMAYAISTFVSQSFLEISEGALITFRVAKMILGMLGVVFVMGGIVGIPVGIVLLVQSEKDKPESK
jgi:hypothetical protein